MSPNTPLGEGWPRSILGPHFCGVKIVFTSRVFFLVYFIGGPYVPPLCAVDFLPFFNFYYMVKDVYPARGTCSWRGHVRFLVQLPQMRCDHK